eukprot:SAG31_NODE_32328_length_357_cov_0.806202_1_plen_55_part_01
MMRRQACPALNLADAGTTAAIRRQLPWQLLEHRADDGHLMVQASALQQHPIRSLS